MSSATFWDFAAIAAIAAIAVIAVIAAIAAIAVTAVIAVIAAIAAIATNVEIWAQILSAYWVGRFRRAGCISQDTYLLYVFYAFLQIIEEIVACWCLLFLFKKIPNVQILQTQS